ncbi:MAG: hypothetical protein JNM66_04570 [Bryobacterales bacterium]|nr:hypothetical protein [Bryobacterales bacterium]
MEVRWREGFDDREFVYSDRPREARWADERVEEELLAAGWELESSTQTDGNCCRTYVLAEERDEGGLYELVFVTNPGVIGPPAKEYRAAVAVRGEWAVCSAPFGDSVAEVYRLAGNEWVFQQRLKARYPADVSWLPAVRFVGDVLLVGTPMDGAVLRFGMDWVEREALRSELGNFGLSVAGDGEWTAVNGWNGKRLVTVLRRSGAGPLRVETRLESGLDKESHTVSLCGEWVALAGSGKVHLFRNGVGGWAYHSSVDGVGGAVALAGERMVVAGEGEAVFFRFREEIWATEGRVGLGELQGEAFVEWGGDTVAIGFPYCYGAAGVVVLLRENEGRWAVVQRIQALDGRLGARFGESLSLEGEHLMVGAQGVTGGGGCGYIYRRRGQGSKRDTLSIENVWEALAFAVNRRNMDYRRNRFASSRLAT